MRPRPLVDNLVRQELGPALVIARRQFIRATTSPRFLEDCALRYEQGQAEYGFRYEWMEWSDAAFEGEVYKEVLDIPIYESMHRATRILREAGWRR